jgi:aryl-alcohol dehydrogenase-like predicted oxidoreductase
MTLRLGFGVSGPLGQWWFEAARTRGLIEGALRGGVAHFDTAPFYFDAEPRLGEALREFGRNDVIVSTKTGTRRKGRGLVKDFSEVGICADVDQSRRALGRDALDLLYLHGPTSTEIDACLPTLEALKREGKVARIGVCGEGAPLHRAIGAGFDAIMGVYNIVDRRHERVFAEAKAKGVMTVAIAPLAQGLFDRRKILPRELADLWRMARASLRPRYRKKDIAAARAAIGAAGAAEAALGFALANPDIDIVMTTTTKLDHLARSLAVASGTIEPVLFARLRTVTLDPPFAGA